MSFDARRRGIRKTKLGSGREATSKRAASQNGGPEAIASSLVDRILEAAGAQPDSRQLMRAALEQLSEYTGCEAAGIRLEESGDYPYVVALGFPAKYLATENSLLRHGPDRNPVYDDEGRPVLECACGDIIRGRIPTDHPRFTTEGTFWTGSTTEEGHYDDRDKSLSPLRGHCAAGGYESVACIPLRAHDKVYGILQLNSKRRHLITPEVLSVLEPAVAAFGSHLRERLADEAERSSEALHEALSAAMVEAFAYCRLYFDEHGSPEDWAYVTVNKAFRKLFGIADPTAKRNSQVMPGWQERLPDVVELFGRVVRTGKPERLERRLSKLDKWLVLRVSSPAPDHFLAVFEDVSERKFAEERLLRTQFSLDNIGDYPLWIDAQGRVVDVSESTCRHLEYSRDELLSMTLFDIDPGLNSDEWRSRWRESIESGPKIVERQHRTKNGRAFPVEVSTSHVSFGGEEYDCQFCRDISKRRQAEEKLERALYALDTATDYPLWVDAEGRVFEVSQSTCRHLEYSRDELLSMTIFEIDADLTTDEWQRRWTDLKGRRTHTVEVRHRTKSGRVFPVEIVVDQVSFGGQEYSCGFCRDISDRKAMEEKLQRTQFTIDSMDDYLMWGDLDGNILDVSESACRHLEYSRDELLSMTAFDIDPDLTPEGWAGHVASVRDHQSDTVEIRHMTKSGRVFPVEVVVTRMVFGGKEYDCSFCRDITERKQTEEKLERAQFFLDHVDDYPMWTDVNARIVDVSETTCRRLEYSREELLSMTVFDIDPTLEREKWATRWEETRTAGPRFYETQNVTKSGRTFPVEVIISRVVFGGQEYDCGMMRDISNRKQTEEKLERAQFSLDNVTDYPLWVDAEGRIFEVSDSTCRHLEYSRDELLSMTVFDIDPATSQQTWPDYWKVAAERSPFVMEIQHRTKSGRFYPVEAAVAHVSFGGNEYDCAFCRDISERKQTEEKLRRTQFTVDHMSDYPMWTDSQGRIVEVGETTCRRLEYSREELLSMTVFDVDIDTSQDDFAAHLKAIRESGFITIEIRHRTKSGRFYPVEVAVVYVAFDGQEFTCGFCRDISERKQTEEKLRRTQFTVDRMSDYPIWVDSEARIVDVGDSTCRRLEYSREELLSMTLFDLNPELARQQWAGYFEEVREKGSRVHEAAHRTKSGKVYPVEISADHVSIESRDYVCCFCRDISERRKAEEVRRRTQFTVDHMSDYLLWLDPEAHIVEVSESTCRRLGYSRRELLNMTVFDIDPAITRERWMVHWQRIRDSGTRTIEVEHRSKDGSLHPVEIATTHVSFAGEEYDCSFCRDITERKQMEESLRLNRLTVDQALDMVFWIAPDGRLVYANESACRVAQRSLEEMTELYAWDLDPSLSGRAWEETWQLTREQGPFQQEGLLLSADGCLRPVEISSYHVDFEGNEYGVAFARDITQRKRAEQELRDSEERYRQLFEVESDAIVLTDAGSGRILDVNPAAVELFGYSRDELLELSSTDLSVEPEPGRDYPGELASGAILRWNRRKDGTVFPTEVRYRYFELEGRQVRVAAIRDVTERLKAEEELLESRQMLQLVLDTVPLRIVWKDRDLRYLGCNKAMALDLRLPDPSVIAGLTDEDLLPDTRAGFPPSAHSDDLEVIRTGVAKLHYEETTAPKEGTPRMIRTSKVPLRDLSGDIIGLLAIHEDVTERTMTLRALREREEQLRHSQKLEAVGRLAGGIAHDFNNVLTTIIGYSDLVLGSPEGSVGSVADDVREIKAAAERASALTKQILAFSRRQSLRPEVLSLNRLIMDIQRMLARTIGADIELVTVLDPDLGLVDVDEHQFVQIMLNLTVNARDAMPAGGTVTVTTANVELDEAFCQTHPDAQPGSYVMMSVADTGTGMDEKTLAHVFEPFFTTKPTGEGTGLGLATVYGVIAQSGGYTCVESELGRGATFTIYLPRLTSDFDGRAKSLLPAGLSTLDTVLVVDDDDAFRALTIRILEKRGYRTIPASDGDQAVEILQNRDILVDLLLVDIVMPGSLQGDQVGQIAARLRPGLPVIYMSSYSRDTILNIGPASVASDYLEKPFTADALVQKIRSSLGRDQADVSKT